MPSFKLFVFTHYKISETSENRIIYTLNIICKEDPCLFGKL